LRLFLQLADGFAIDPLLASYRLPQQFEHPMLGSEHAKATIRVSTLGSYWRGSAANLSSSDSDFAIDTQ
jgi:hypothetical protein